jgi:transcriptional regulator with XRE-family HTH domain
MTQDDLATATGKHRATIARLETGNAISVGTLYAIAEILKVEYSILTGEAGTLGPGYLTAENTSEREEVMEHVRLQALALTELVSAWETKNASGLTIGELAKAIERARLLRESIEALDALEIKGHGELPPMGPSPSPD